MQRSMCVAPFIYRILQEERNLKEEMKTWSSPHNLCCSSLPLHICGAARLACTHIKREEEIQLNINKGFFLFLGKYR